MTTGEEPCSVCGAVMAPHMVAFCDSCGLHYHLNQRSDLPGEDCGEVWINEDHLGLEFACNRCLHPQQAEGNLDDILDLPEAAAVALMTEDSLAEAARRGQIRHRRTGSGVYLFERRDVVMFVQDGK